jgi:hypothetical protein
MRLPILALALVAVLTSFSGSVWAAVIATYDLKGFVSGSLNNISFSNANFNILMTADPSNVTFRNNNEYDILGNISISISGFSTVNVDGYVKQLVSSPTSWFSFQAGTIGRGTGIINGIDGAGTDNYLNQNYTATMGYNGNFPSPVNTSGGALFASGAYATSFTVSVQPVPEPSGFSLLAVGLGSLALVRRRRL